MKDISLRLKEARINAGFASAKEFAISNNIPLSTYFMHENGRRGLRVCVAKYYCRLLNINIEWLLTGSIL